MKKLNLLIHLSRFFIAQIQSKWVIGTFVRDKQIFQKMVLHIMIDFLFILVYEIFINLSHELKIRELSKNYKIYNKSDKNEINSFNKAHA